MKKFYLFLMAFLCISTVAMAVDPICYYHLRMTDSYGDGWIGNSKIKVTDGDSVMYFKCQTTSYDQDGNDCVQFATVPYYGNEVTFHWSKGQWDDEAAFVILSSTGVQITKVKMTGSETEGELKYTMTSSPCASGENANAPQNISGVLQANNVLQVTWDEVTGASSYLVDIILPDGKSYVADKSTTSKTYTTGELSQSGEYTIVVSSLGSSSEILGFSQKKVAVNLPVLTSVKVSALIPFDCGMDVSEGAWLCWFKEENGQQHIVPMEAKGNQRFEVTFNPNAVHYGFYILNKASLLEENVHRTYSYTNLMATEVCGHVAYSVGINHYFNGDDCSYADHDYRAYDLTATPQANGKVLFEWKTKDVIGTSYSYAVYVEYGGDSYKMIDIPGGETSYAETALFNVAENTEIEAWRLQYSDNDGNTRLVEGESFTVNANSYMPTPILAEKQTGDVWKITWSSATAPAKYKVYIDASLKAETTETSYTTGSGELSSGSHTVDVICCDASDNILASNSQTFSTATVTAHDVDVYVYFPQVADMTTTDGYALLWNYPGFAQQTATLELQSNRWYKASITGLTQNDILITVINAQTPENATIIVPYTSNLSSSYAIYGVVNKDNAGNRFFEQTIDSYYDKDWTPNSVNVQATGGKLSVSWSTAEAAASQYKVTVFSEAGYQLNSSYTYAKNKVFNMPYSTDTTVYVRVIPCYSGSYCINAYAAYSSSVIAPATPYLVKDIQITPNSDGTYTISWTAPDVTDLNDYEIIINEKGGANCYSKTTTETSVRTDVFYKTGGVFECYIYANGDNGNGFVSKRFEVESVDPREVTVRALLHPDCGYDTSSGVSFWYDDYILGTQIYATAVDEGDYWYSTTFTLRTPATKLGCANANDNVPVSGNACFEYNIDDNLTPVSCDAQAHDYRIESASMTANSVDGRLDLSWSAQDVAEQYYVKIIEISTSNVLASAYVDGETHYAYMVPDSYDGKSVKWTVQPVSPYEYDEEEYTSPTTLQKSTVTLTELKATTTDNKSIDMSWTCNTPALKFAIQVTCYGYLLKLDTVATASYHYTAPMEGYYSWKVCPLDPTDNGALHDWVWGNSIYIHNEGESTTWITDVQGSANQRQLTFTWATDAPRVHAYISWYDTVYDYYAWKADSIMEAKTWVYNATKDGMYQIELHPMTEYEPGKYAEIGTNDYKATVTAFTGKTYKVSITAGEGGLLYPGEVIGELPDGYTVSVSAGANTGYRFVNWSDGMTEANREITIHSALTLVANFEKALCHLVVNTNGHGKVHVNDMYNAIDDSFDAYDKNVDTGWPVYLTAVPDADYAFEKWSDGVTDINRTIDLTSDTLITAIFQPVLTLTVNVVGTGLYNVDGYLSDLGSGKYSVVAGKQITLTAIATGGYRFVGWSNGVQTLQNTISLTENTTITATFENAGTTPTYTLTFTTTGTDGKGGGTVNGTNGTYYEGDQLALVATPNTGSHFVKWSDDNTENPRTYTVTTSTTITAVFAINKYSLLVTITGGSGSITGTANGTYEHGTTINLTATPAEHYHFVGWSDDKYGMFGATRTFTLTDDVSFQAIFAADQYTITFVNEDESFIESKRWDYNSTPECSVTPTKAKTPQYVYSFAGWDPEIVKVTKDAVYKATFSQSLRKYTVTFVDWDDKVLDTQKVAYGKAAEAPANPKREGYTFTGWDKEFTNITADLTVKALYEQNQGIEITNDQPMAQKVLIDGRVYILRGDKLYTVQGQLVNDKQ